MGRTLIILGLLIAGVGMLMTLGLPIGRLPGDFTIRRGSFSFYFPLATSIVGSILLTLLFMFLGRGEEAGAGPSIKADKWIKKMALEHGMIEPFEDRQVRAGVISYGLSSYGYDIRVADEFKVFTNINTTVV